MASRRPCGRVFPRVGDLINITLSDDMVDVINRELQSGTEAIPKLENNFNMVMTDIFEKELLSLFKLQDPYSIFSEKLETNLVGSVSEGFGLPEYIHLEEDSSLRVAVRDEADFNLVWSSLKLSDSNNCSSLGDLDGEVEFSSEFPGYATVKLVKNEALTRWIDLSNIAMNCDGSKVTVYLHPTAVTDEFYLSLHLRSVLSNLIVNSFNREHEKQNNNSEKEETEERFTDLVKTKLNEKLTFQEFSQSCREVQRSQNILFVVDQGGPAVNVSAFVREGGGAMFDMALCLSFPYWPAVANDWITRHRPSGWPSPELVSLIVKEGCALVPVSPLRSLTGLEWRISFSSCERKLAQSLSSCQKGCFLIMKGIWRHFLKHPCKKGVQSYHLKTAMFWVCEEVSPADWRKDKIGVGALRILQKLYSFLVNMCCPHYLIPENNLFQDIEEDVLMATLQRVSIAIASRQQIWYDNPALLNTLQPENSRLHLNRLEDKAFREAIEKVFCICYDLALHEDPPQYFEKKLAYIIQEALQKCSQAQGSLPSLTTTFFVTFESTLLQQFWASSTIMRKYIGGRMPPQMIALCAWLDLFKFGFNLFVCFSNQEAIKDLMDQVDTVHSDQDSDCESADSLEECSDHVLLNLTQAFMGNDEFDLDMVDNEDSEEEVEDESDD